MRTQMVVFYEWLVKKDILFTHVLVTWICQDSGNKACNYQFVWKQKQKHAKHYRDTHYINLVLIQLAT